MNRKLLVRSLALVAAVLLGLVVLGALDAWRPATSLFDRFWIWTTGSVLFRTLGVWAGAPLRRQDQGLAVTRSGLFEALLVACSGFLLGIPVLVAISAPALDPEMALHLARVDLTSAAVSL
ncbi:MAG TPA: hypothetical protein VGL86_06010, partial [Polyangia bacterium]